MKLNDALELLLLAALWGASFLFMRTATPEFGPICLAALRTGIAALCLLPLVLFSGKAPIVRKHWRPIFVVGVLNSALPFCLFSYSTVYLGAGFSSIVNASTAMWAALVAYVWLGDNLSKLAVLGLLLGFFGVVVLSFAKTGVSLSLSVLPVFAALAATFCYGVSACYMKRHLLGVNVLAVTAGSQLASGLLLAPLALVFWPDERPSTGAWVDVSLLACGCTALAFILYFRLISNIGAAKTMTVVYLIPVFGVVWGMIFLNEILLPTMFAGALFILLGVSLTTGMVKFRKKTSPV